MGKGPGKRARFAGFTYPDGGVGIREWVSTDVREDTKRIKAPEGDFLGGAAKAPERRNYIRRAIPKVTSMNTRAQTVRRMAVVTVMAKIGTNVREDTQPK